MALRILTVCTANVCRSTMTAVLLQHRLDNAHIAAVVTSAGTLGGVVDGDPLAVAALSARGLDLIDHCPRRVSAHLLATDGADLVIVMTNAHLREVAVMAPGVFQRAFTIKELANRAADLGAPASPPEVTDLGAWRSALGSDRSPADLITDGVAGDVADPYGKSLAAHARTADELDRMLAVIVGSMQTWLGDG